jgi:GT2 family glycosyltransferase
VGALDSLIDVSIVIVNWNTRELLRACLASIVQNIRRLRTEILVVDNGSRDGSAQMVARDFPTVRLLVNSRNLGFAAANNRGLSQATGRYLLLLNSDTVVLPDAVEEMVRYADAHRQVGALGPRLLNKDGSPQVSVAVFPRLHHDAAMILDVKHWPVVGTLAQRYKRRAYAYKRERACVVDGVIGACLLLRREAIEQTGLLDDQYFFFFEELDLCYRLRQRGWATVYLGPAQIVHRGGQSWAPVSVQRLVWYYKGLLRFYHLHRSRRRYLVVRISIALGAFAHIVWLLPQQCWSPGDRLLLAAYGRILAHATAR